MLKPSLQGSLDLYLYSEERALGGGGVGEGRDQRGAPGRECGLASLAPLSFPPSLKSTSSKSSPPSPLPAPPDLSFLRPFPGLGSDSVTTVFQISDRIWG